MQVEKEKPMPLIFESIKLECGYRIDLLVEHKVVIEIKSVETLNDVHLAQTLTYMRLGNYKLGLLINFNVSILKYGIKRVVNNL
jgi:GxxExxY protein